LSIIDQLSQLYNLTDDQNQKIANRIHNAILEELRIGFGMRKDYQKAMGYYPFNKHRFRDKSRRKINGKTIYLCDVLDLSEYYEIITTGSNRSKMRTQVTTKIPLKYILATDTIDDIDIVELTKWWYSDFEEQLAKGEYDKLHLNMTSLFNYIRHTEHTIDTHEQLRQTNRADKLREYLHYAKSLYKTHAHFGYLPQIRSDSLAGRRYYKGLSLQNVPTAVREAAIGKSYKIDVENSVFQWKYNTVLGIAKEQGIEISMPATVDYIQFKQKYRESIAQKVYAGVKNLSDSFKINKIKTCFTAIGFGAKTKDMSAFGSKSLQQIFSYNGNVMTRQLTAFLNDPFVKEFTQEQDQLTNIIYEYAKETFKQLDPESEIVKHLKDGRGFNRSKIVSYLYQKSESELMDPVYDFLGDRVILRLHDGFYADRKLTTTQKIEVKSYYQDNGFKVDIEEIEDYVYGNAGVDEVLEHKQRIAQEEAVAKGTGNHYSDDIPVRAIPKHLPKVKKQISDNDCYDSGCAFESNYDPYFDPNVEDPEAYMRERSKHLPKPVDPVLEELLKR